jgi:hypothetical protein
VVQCKDFENILDLAVRGMNLIGQYLWSGRVKVGLKVQRMGEQGRLWQAQKKRR